MVEVFLSLGSNQGDRKGNLEEALNSIRSFSEDMRNSRFYQNPAQGFQGGEFLNVVSGIKVNMDVYSLLTQLQSIEWQMGRARGQEGPTDRSIDIDILSYTDMVLQEVDLEIPHPRSQYRDFVMIPWADLAPSLIFPGAMESIGDLSKRLEETGQWLG
jgi:2-amino-4-hydroxy-6-hydroxymethyldihydropteridine diphosphokinase